MAVVSRTTQSRTTQKQKPIEPEWHKKLKPLAVIAGGYKNIGAPEVIEFKNLCRRLMASRVLISWNINGNPTVYRVEWTARDPQWSGNA